MSGLANPGSRTGRVFRWNIILIGFVALGVLSVEGALLLRELLILIAGVLFITYFLIGPVDFLDGIIQRVKPVMPSKMKNLAWLPSINPRFFSVLMVFVGFVMLLAAVTVMVLPVISSQVAGFAKDLPGYYQQLEDQFEKLSKMRLGQLLFQSVLQPESRTTEQRASQEVIVKVETLQEKQGAKLPVPGQAEGADALDRNRAPSQRLNEEGMQAQKTGIEDQPGAKFLPEESLSSQESTETQAVDGSEAPVETSEGNGDDEASIILELGEEPVSTSEERQDVIDKWPDLRADTQHRRKEVADDYSLGAAAGQNTAETVQVTTETHIVRVKDKTVADQKQKTALGQILSYFQRYASATFLNLMEVITTSFTGLIYFLTGLVLTFYFLLDGPRLKDGFVGLMPAQSRTLVDGLLKKSHFLLVQFLRIQVFFALITGIILYGIYTLLGLKYAGFLSLFFALLSLIPVLGPCIGAIPSAMVLIFTDQPYFALVIFTLVAGFYLVKQRWLVGRMFGKHQDLNPILMLVLLMVCLQVLGIGGLILAIPLACLITAAIHNWRRNTGAADKTEMFN